MSIYDPIKYEGYTGNEERFKTPLKCASNDLRIVLDGDAKRLGKKVMFRSLYSESWKWRTFTPEYRDVREFALDNIKMSELPYYVSAKSVVDYLLDLFEEEYEVYNEQRAEKEANDGEEGDE